MGSWAEAPQQRDQLVLFKQRLDDALPPGHAVRILDEILRQLNWSLWEARYHARLGQPAIHPRILASVLLYGLLTRIRSSRNLEEALVVRMDFRWLVEGRTIDHSTISEFRRKHREEVKDLFIQVCEVARDIGLLSFQQLGFDGTRIRANNRRSGTRTLDELRRERDELANRFEELEKQAEADDAREEELFGDASAYEVPADLQDKKNRLEKLQQVIALHERAQQEGQNPPKRLPVTDLDARVMPNKDGGFAPNYTPVNCTDIGSGIITYAEVIPVLNEDGHLIPAIEEVQEQYGLTSPLEVLTDKLNCTGANLAQCEERGITMYSPCAIPDPATNPALREDPQQPVAEAEWERLPRSKVKCGGVSQMQIDKSAFVYDEQSDCYWCPLGKRLAYSTTTSEACRSGRRVRNRYQARRADCESCPLKKACLKGRSKSRQINREQYEGQRERHAKRMAKPQSQAIYAKRRHPVERPFGFIKHVIGMRRFLLRGLEGVRSEWRWACMAFNFHRLISTIRARAGPA